MSTVKFHGFGYGLASNPQLFVTIDGRQALKEGPRRVGQCVYCGGPCEGVTTMCEERVWKESRQ